eukprot:m.357234 g.357234  ORF g.357234 m.357234 type:complete len:295 (-) comp17746_c0_seq1:527-1411(-)
MDILTRTSPASAMELDSEAFAELNQALAQLSPQQILQWLHQQQTTVDSKKIVQFTSCGLSGMAITDMIAQAKYTTPIVFIDTLYHFDETLALVEKVQDHYPHRELLTYTPQTASTRAKFESLYDTELYEKDPDLYQYMTKVEPTMRALDELKVQVWITGRRRSQGGERETLQVLELMENGILKCNPLAWWSWKQTWAYVKENQVPYNSLLDKGYRSVGDVHATNPTANGADERSGRWSGSFRTECGMHSSTSSSPSRTHSRTHSRSYSHSSAQSSTETSGDDDDTSSQSTFQSS